MRYTFFHWGIHAWAIYGIVALVLAYFNFRHGKPGLISATLNPIFGDRVNGPARKVVDIISVVATVIGVATTLGFGAVKISDLATEESLFGVLANYPLISVMSILAMVLIGTFFITSADSGTFVLGMMTTNGSLTPGNKIKFTWGIILAAISLVLLYSGGLQALQNTMIVAALPFSVIMCLMAISLIKALNKEAKKLGIGKIPKRKPQ